MNSINFKVKYLNEILENCNDTEDPSILEWIKEYMMSSYFSKIESKYTNINGDTNVIRYRRVTDNEYKRSNRLIVYLNDGRSYSMSLRNLKKFVRSIPYLRIRSIFSRSVMVSTSDSWIIPELIDIGYSIKFNWRSGFKLLITDHKLGYVYNENFLNNFKYNVIDCRNNIDLFLALSALKSDDEFMPDYMQWFTDGKGNWKLCYSSDWLGELSSLSANGGKWSDYHKASIEELINHFRIS